MNVKKAGLITGGVLAAMVAASPLAWAVGPSQVAEPGCTFSATGSDVPLPALPQIPGTAIQTPVSGNNAGIHNQCSTFGQHNGEGNGVGNLLNGTPLPSPPALP